MTIRRIPAQLFFATVLFLNCISAQAGQTLLAGKSSIHFISVKNNDVAEVHHFKTLSGGIDGGKVSVSIPLVDVETLIPIRNERMQTMLFETELYPRATLSADVDMGMIMALENGEYADLTVQFNLVLHTRRKLVTARVTVARLGDEIHVTTAEPLILSAAYFNMSEGVEKLRDVAGLKMISTAVPVTARLVFSR
jgi:hypothetical protein